MASPRPWHEEVVVDLDLAYSVDRSWGNVKANANGEMHPSDSRKMHRPRPESHAQAVCSPRILLNAGAEPGIDPGELAPSARCSRCFPDLRGATR